MVSRNPAWSRPLSRNVKRLMKMARESPENPDVLKLHRIFTEKDITYCDMQGQIFMAAVDKGVSIEHFAEVYMNSQFAGVMDYSFSCSGGIDSDDISQLLKVPLLLKSPETIVEVVMWLDTVVRQLDYLEEANTAVIEACMDEIKENEPPGRTLGEKNLTVEEWADRYEYAYWLGYIYRYECLLHEESSRMVYGAFNESFMRRTYKQLLNGMKGEKLASCAGEICRRIDMLLVGKLWK